MKRLHVNLAVADLEASVRFYASNSDAQPSVQKEDYAKWMLDDPRVNFAITTRGLNKGIDHLGIQVENENEQGVIRFIHGLKKKGFSLRVICKELEKEGHMTKRGKSTWHPQTVCAILKRTS